MTCWSRHSRPRVTLWTSLDDHYCHAWLLLALNAHRTSKFQILDCWKKLKILTILISPGLLLSACDIFDNDSDPRLNLQIDNPVTPEGADGTATQQFTLTVTPQSRPVILRVNTEDDTAIAGADYVGITNGLVSIPAGESTATVSVDIIGDEDFEPDEVYKLEVSTISGQNESAQGTGTITNDDLEPGLQVSATYTYDDLNRVIAVSYDNGKSIRYTYDADGNVLSVEAVEP